MRVNLQGDPKEHPGMQHGMPVVEVAVIRLGKLKDVVNAKTAGIVGDEPQQKISKGHCERNQREETAKTRKGITAGDIGNAEFRKQHDTEHAEGKHLNRGEENRTGNAVGDIVLQKTPQVLAQPKINIQQDKRGDKPPLLGLGFQSQLPGAEIPEAATSFPHGIPPLCLRSRYSSCRQFHS